jgi:chemotaxis protein methyltransferase CheR
MSISKALEDLEITLLLEAIYQRFGDDFRGYQKDVIRRKLHAFMLTHNLATISRLQDCILHDATYIDPLVCALDAHPSSLFDHPKHMRELRTAMIPWLRSSPAPKIWIAECAAAEDVYSMAIMLMEEGVYHKTQIFATGANPLLLNDAREAKFPLEKLPQYEENYVRAGGTESLSDYYSEVKSTGVFRNELKRNITWAQYNLGTDASFNEFELIVCRGSLNDFSSRLRRRALQVFYDSLPTFGMLSLADVSYAELTPFISHFTVVSPQQGLYRKLQ